MFICARTSQEKVSKKGILRQFEVLSHVPEVNVCYSDDDIRIVVCSVFPLVLFSKQPSDNVFKYDYYYCTFCYLNDDNDPIDYFSSYVCVKKEV